jgi:hypothetical protein
LLLIASTGLCLTEVSAVCAEEKPTARLSYERDASAQSCPDEESMRQGVAARLGREPFKPQAERLLTIRLRATHPGFGVAIAVHDAEGTVVGKRELQTKKNDCGELASAMQLAIAIAIDPLHQMPAPAPQPTAIAEPSPPPVEQPQPRAPSAQIHGPPLPPPALPQPTTRDHVGVGLRVGASSEPSPTMGLTVHYRRRTGSLSWGLEGRYDSTNETEAKSGQIETSLWAASALLCLHRGALEACALASAGNLQGRGVGFNEARSFSNPYGAAGARLARAFPVQGNFAIIVGGEALARVNSTTLYIDTDEVWTSSPLEIALGAQAVWALH